MHELKPVKFYKIKEHIGFDNLSPEPISVILGNNPGSIFVDNYKCPKSALIWSQGIEGFYLIGDEKNKKFITELNSFIDKVIAPMLKRGGYDYLEFSPCNDAWYEVIERIFKNRKMDSWKQLTYLMEKNNKTDNNKLNPEYNIRSIKDKFDLNRLTNKKHLINTLLLFWDSIDNLTERGSCYYAEKDNKVIGLCYTGFITPDKKVIGIETNKEYRRKGIAYNLALKCINEIFDDGKTPYWDCMEKNIPSKTLAEKIGFKKIGEYICYGFPI